MRNGSYLVVVAHLAVLAKHKDNCSWDVKKTPVFPFSPTLHPDGVLVTNRKNRPCCHPSVQPSFQASSQLTNTPCLTCSGEKKSLK